MLIRSSAKVGAVVLLALVLGYALYLQLAHIRTDTYSVRLIVEDTQGLSSQSVVRMQGVSVGDVASVDLGPDNKPLIYLAIKRKYRIPESYHFKITSGILITQAQVNIVPPDQLVDKHGRLIPNTQPVTYIPTDNTATRVGDKAPSSLLASISPELETSLDALNLTFTTITNRFNDAYGKIDTVLNETKRLMSTANMIATSTKGIITDPDVKSNLIASISNVRKTTDDAHLIASQLRRDIDEMVDSSKGSLKDLGTKVNSLLDHVDATIQDTDTVVQKLTEQVTDPHLQQSLEETADLARTTLARFNQIASDLHALTGDPELQGDLKRTVANLNRATEHGEQAMQKVDQFIGNLTGGRARAPRMPKINFTESVAEQISPTRNRIDLDAIAPIGSRGLLDVGLFDVGQDTRLNLQAGNRLSANTDIRYGVHASRIGAGADFWAQPGTGITLDLYNTDKVQLDVRGLYRVNKSASLWVGGDNLLRNPVPLIGIQFNQ